MVFMNFFQNLQLYYLCQHVENTVLYLHVVLGHALVLIDVRPAVRPNVYLHDMTVLSYEVPTHYGCVWDMKDVDDLKFPYQFTGSFDQILREGIEFGSVR